MADPEQTLGEQHPEPRAESRRDDPEASPELRLVARVREVYRLAAKYYGACLARAGAGAAARDYVERLGITPPIAERFQLGYAPATGDALLRFLEWEGVPEALAEQLGLIARGGRGTFGPYDRLQDCLVLPLPEAGAAQGLGGWTLDEASGPQHVVRGRCDGAPLWADGDHLFGLMQAEESMVSREGAVLVADPLDVLVLHSLEVTEAVAPAGGAELSPRQADILAQGVGRGHVVVLDAGETGAALRLSALRALGPRLTRVVTIPGGRSLAAWARVAGREALVDLIHGDANPDEAAAPAPPPAPRFDPN
ncbi:MAG TPA: hypothetical protein VGQ83_36125 [Polyangia bacterium]|jgi:DNA primase